MTKNWVAFVSVLLLLATPAVAASWTDNFKVVDTDGNGALLANAASHKQLDSVENRPIRRQDRGSSDRVCPEEKCRTCLNDLGAPLKA